MVEVERKERKGPSERTGEHIVRDLIIKRCCTSAAAAAA